ncbi:hypothetical protein H2248_000449 [Termitomyces sp. 'cryptogamus']|nr:hypothetical protein H2248_000449 [Termitomyces sp. 'cryptogamus']
MAIDAVLAPNPIELIFLGTGTSSSLPHVDCLTAPPEAKPCKTCLSTLTPEGKKNIRRNTSVALRLSAKDGRKVTVVVDAGKNFQAAALEWFPKYGLRRIDALLITHAHADAMNGLDDLRGWTLNTAIQSHIDVYVSQSTFEGVQRSFPYLVAKEFASGGGDVPEFKWHIIEDNVPFEILDTGIQITPFAVHHGRVFSVVPPLAPTSSVTTISTPVKPTTLLSKLLPDQERLVDEVKNPYLCFGFKFGHDIVYISDVSYIPEDKWPIVESRPSNGRALPVLVLDCLRLRPHTSHFGLENAVDSARRIDATRTYLIGFGHEVAHDDLVMLGEAVGGKALETETLTETVKAGLELIQQGKNVWVRPSHDGLRVFVGGDGRVHDSSY